MLVPAMNLVEIKKEIEKDSPILFRKIGYVAKKIDRHLKKNKKITEFSEVYEYYSKYKNYWLYKLFLKDKVLKYEAMIVYNDIKGHSAIAVVDKNHLVYHTSHFFMRYNERLNLGLNNFKDIIKEFMKENEIYRFQQLEEIEPGIHKMFCILPSGVILGTFYKGLNIVKANTFISNDMLRNDQIKMKINLTYTIVEDRHTLGIKINF